MDFLLLGREPIRAGEPAGSDAKYDPEFEGLQAEIDKLSSPSATEGANWKKVSEISSRILSEKSKDILAAGYFAVSGIYLNQMEGLRIGLTVYCDLIETFWETLYPPLKRMKGRVNAIAWWIEKTETALLQLKPTPVSDEIKAEIQEKLNKIETLLNGCLPEPISVRPIQRALDNLSPVSASAPPLKPQQPEKSPAPEQPVPESSPQRAAHEETPARVIPPPPAVAAPPQPEAKEMASIADARKLLEYGFDNVTKAAAYLTVHQPANPLGYQCSRMALWSLIEELPSTTEGNRTLIPAPELHIITALKELKGNGQFKDLLEYAEGKLPESVFWIDLNRYVAESLTALGGQYDQAKEAVCRETAFFIHRLSGVETLEFANGAPFADDETAAWLKEIALGGMPAIAGSMTFSPVDDTGRKKDFMEEEIEKSQELLRQKKVVEAVQSLQNNLRNSFSNRETLLWRLALCQILITSKKTGTVTPHLEQILSDIEKYRLEEWDPDLALKGLKMAWAGFSAHPDKDFKVKSEGILGRIAKLDPVEALKLAK